MSAKRLIKLIVELENEYYKYGSSEAAIQQIFVIARQDELKRMSYKKVYKILKGLMNNIRTYLGKYIEDYEIFDMINFNNDNKIYNFMLNMKL